MPDGVCDSLPMPATLEEALDPAWLTAALAPVSGGAQVEHVTLSEFIKTMASKIRIAVRFAGETQDRAYCLKAFLGGDQMLGGATTIREADFYTRIAPHLTMRTPFCANAILNRKEQTGILLLEDLIAAGARFCSALEPFDIPLVRQSLDQLARLHAARALVAPNADWTPSRITNIAAKPHFSVEVLQGLMDDPRGVGLTARTRDAALLLRAMAALAERAAAQPVMLLHGDCHAGNLYVTADGPGFTDWQLVQRGPWALDVAYHVAAVLPVELAEKHERELVDHYLDCVKRHGGAPPDRETAWVDYRAAQPYGYYHWAITRRVDPPIIREFMIRLGAAVTRNDSYSLLGL